MLPGIYAHKTHCFRIHSGILANIHLASISSCLHIHTDHVQLSDLLLPNGRHFYKQNGDFR